MLACPIFWTFVSINLLGVLSCVHRYTKNISAKIFVKNYSLYPPGRNFSLQCKRIAKIMGFMVKCDILKNINDTSMLTFSMCSLGMKTMG